MKVAYVLEEYPELSQTFVETEMRAVGDVTVLALRPGSMAALADPRFTPHYPPPPLMRLVPRRLQLSEHWPSDGKRLRGALRIAKWRSLEFDHAHAHFASEAADIAALLGRPHSFTGHSTDLFTPELPRRVAAAKFAAVVCEYDRREVEKVAEGRVEVVPVGLDLDAVRRTTPYDPDGPVVAVGRLVEQKGFADLDAVASQVPREVIIAGAGPVKLDNVTLPGALKPVDSLKLIERASLLVAPSVIAKDGSRDGIPTVVKEALALGVPVVASSAVGNPEVIEPEHGTLFPPGDRPALLEAIRATLDRDRAAMGRAARAWAERNADVRRSAAKLRQLWAE
jgi:glycosyltransferase involved in cell wall biosynthesis